MRWLPSVLAATLLLAGCDGDVDPARTPAGMAQAQLLEDLYNGRVQKAYDALHPAYRRIVTRARFVDCTRKAGLGGLDSIEILNVYDDPVRLPSGKSVKAKAVRVRLKSSAGDTTPFVNHEVKVGNRWLWILNRPALEVYATGKCPV